MVSIEEGKKEMVPTISGKAEGGLKDGVSWLESKDALPRKTMAFRITLMEQTDIMCFKCDAMESN